MSTLQAAISATLPQKRKRDTISYAELDINDVDDEEEVALEETGRLSDSEDEAYGSRKVRRSLPLDVTIERAG